MAGGQALAVAVAAVAAMIALLIGRFAMPIGQAFGLMDFPDTNGGRKRHRQVTPLVGGTALIAALIAAGLMVFLWSPSVGPLVATQLAWFTGTVIVMYLIGLADDRFELGAVIRLLLAVLMLLLVVTYVPDFAVGFLRFSGQPQLLLLGGWSAAFTLLCLVGLLNAVNMADGKNGVVISLGLIWSVLLALRMPPPMLPLVVAAFAALAVLLWFNMQGRLFLGDGGSYAISTTFGLLGVYCYNHDFAGFRADDVALMFAIPVFDTIRLMAVRMSQRRSPFEADRNHLHHHLHQHWGWPRGLLVYVALVAVPNAAAVLVPGTAAIWLAASFIAYAIVLRLSSFNAPVAA